MRSDCPTLPQHRRKRACVTAIGFARFCQGRVHYAWIVLAVVFCATCPFLTGLIDVIGLKRTILGCMMMLIAGTGLSNFMTTPWHCS